MLSCLFFEQERSKLFSVFPFFLRPRLSRQSILLFFIFLCHETFFLQRSFCLDKEALIDLYDPSQFAFLALRLNPFGKHGSMLSEDRMNGVLSEVFAIFIFESLSCLPNRPSNDEMLEQ